MIDPTGLTEQQADGLACVVCGISYLTSTAPAAPVGTVAGAQVFACTSHTALPDPGDVQVATAWPAVDTYRVAVGRARALRDRAGRTEDSLLRTFRTLAGRATPAADRTRLSPAARAANRAAERASRHALG